MNPEAIVFPAILAALKPSTDLPIEQSLAM
jgi:hypothetical protein